MQSKPFALYPGVIINGKPAREAVVQPLTRGASKQIAKEPEDQRGDLELARMLARLGDETDQAIIVEAIPQLTESDEALIRNAYARLQDECLELAARASLPPLRRALKELDVVSDPFPLYPGIVVDGVAHRSAIVRLIRRGEWKQIERVKDILEKDDHAKYFCIAQIGTITDVTFEHIDLLTDPDIERIDAAYEELRAQHAPRTKSEG